MPSVFDILNRPRMDYGPFGSPLLSKGIAQNWWSGPQGYQGPPVFNMPGWDIPRNPLAPTGQQSAAQPVAGPSQPSRTSFQQAEDQGMGPSDPAQDAIDTGAPNSSGLGPVDAAIGRAMGMTPIGVPASLAMTAAETYSRMQDPQTGFMSALMASINPFGERPAASFADMSNMDDVEMAGMPGFGWDVGWDDDLSHPDTASKSYNDFDEWGEALGYGGTGTGPNADPSGPSQTGPDDIGSWDDIGNDVGQGSGQSSAQEAIDDLGIGGGEGSDSDSGECVISTALNEIGDWTDTDKRTAVLWCRRTHHDGSGRGKMWVDGYHQWGRVVAKFARKYGWFRALTRYLSTAFVGQVTGRRKTALGFLVKWCWAQPLSYGIGLFRAARHRSDAGPDRLGSRVRPLRNRSRKGQAGRSRIARQ